MVNNIRNITESLQDIGLVASDPVHNVVSKLTKQLGSMFLDQDNLVKQNRFLLEADCKAKVDTAVRLLTNSITLVSVSLEVTLS